MYNVICKRLAVPNDPTPVRGEVGSDYVGCHVLIGYAVTCETAYYDRSQSYSVYHNVSVD